MILPAVFRRAARREFEEAALWYEDRRPGLAVEFKAELDRAVMLAAESPQRFALTYRQIRSVRVRRFPYSVLFLAESARIVVLAVFHVRRNPAIWRSRA